LEKVAAELWDAGFGRDIAADRAWLEATTFVATGAAEVLTAVIDTDADNAEEREAEEHGTAAVYLHPEGLLCSVAAWGLDSRGALRAVEAPNAMPPEQAFLAVNAARVRPGDVVMDPCAGGGAMLVAALHLGASLALGADTDATALAAAEDALRRHSPCDATASRAVLVQASLLDGPGAWHLGFGRCTSGGSGRGAGCTAGGVDTRGGRGAGANGMDTQGAHYGQTVGGGGDGGGSDGVGIDGGDGSTKCMREYPGCVDAIVTDLPYGVRSAAVGVGEGPDDSASPADMLDALLRLAAAVLRPNGGGNGVGEGGRIAVWLQHWDGQGGITAEQVRGQADTFGFEVERVAAESRKTGVRRALYVMVRRKTNNTSQGTGGENLENRLEGGHDASANGISTTTTTTASAAGAAIIDDNALPWTAVGRDTASAAAVTPSAVNVCSACEKFGARADAESRRALVMHARLRRNENYGRVAASGGQDVWRAAWAGDVAGLKEHLTHRYISTDGGGNGGRKERGGLDQQLEARQCSLNSVYSYP
jgi:hypothetical protein